MTTMMQKVFILSNLSLSYIIKKFPVLLHNLEKVKMRDRVIV